jgi:rare lipoprotein A
MWRIVAVGVAVLLVACEREDEAPIAVPPGQPGSQTLEPSSAPPLPPAAERRVAEAPYEVGLATWYGAAFAGRRTANGERFDPTAMTAAHLKLPFGTWVEVRRPDNGKKVVVRITDRGPWGDSRRIIDLSRAAADVIDLTAAGVAKVELRVVAPPR